jgi:hypothetical protein
MNFNPLDPLWESYQATEDAFKVASRVIVFSSQVSEKLLVLDEDTLEISRAVTFAEYKRGRNLLNRTKIMNHPRAVTFLDHSLEVINDLFVLSLWATFERYFRDFLQLKGEKVQDMLPVELGDIFYQHLYKEIEYWKPEEMLELLKSSLFKGQEEKIGLTKEVLYYRNWIAHGKNLHRRHPLITPRLAYDRLDEIITVLRTNE